MPLILILALVALLLPATGSVARVAQSQSPLWLVPAGIDPQPNALATAMAKLQEGDAEAALHVFKRFSGNPTVGAYVRLHQGHAELALGDDDAAAASADPDEGRLVCWPYREPEERQEVRRSRPPRPRASPVLPE